MEDFRKTRLHFLAILIQKTFRSYAKRKHFLKLRKSQIIIATTWRTWRVSTVFFFTKSLFLDVSRHDFIYSYTFAWNLLFNSFKECRFGIPFTDRRHMTGLYRLVITFFISFFRLILLMINIQVSDMNLILFIFVGTWGISDHQIQKASRVGNWCDPASSFPVEGKWEVRKMLT